jgi:hypothetical protein
MNNTISFPIDFTISENPFLMFATNYIHFRKDGSIISILENGKSNVYEVWDERYMQDIQIMSYEELYKYLQREPIRTLAKQAQIHLN